MTTPTEMSSRRITARGEQRRDALLAAAVLVLEEHGFAALTHRAVAARARLPLAATTYYFSSLEDLLEQTLEATARDFMVRAQLIMAGLPDGSLTSARVATAIVQLLGCQTAHPDPASLLSVYERYAQAGRRPELRPVVRRWNQAVINLIEQVLHRGNVDNAPAIAPLMLATTDGLLLTALVEGAADPQAAAAQQLEMLLIRLAGAGADSYSAR